MADWQKPEVLGYWLTLVFVLAIVLSGFIIWFIKTHISKMLEAQANLAQTKLSHQKELLQASVDIQEKERNRIAGDLHDELINKLNILILSSSSPNAVDTRKLLQESIQTARRISHDLMPPLLTETSLAEFVYDLSIPLKKRYQVQFFKTGLVEIEIPEKVKIQILRIVQECISNIIKHAQATQISFFIRSCTSYWFIRIEDNGIGYEIQSAKPGLGTKNIELRAQLINASYKIKSQPKKGSSLILLYKMNT